MADKRYDIVGVGNAIVDVLAYKDSEFLAKHGLIKGAMTLVDESESHRLYKLMGAATECSGGSAGNTLAGFAQLGGKAAFIGKIHDDQMGEIYKADMQRSGVHFATEMAESGPSTACCSVFVTEEGGKFGTSPKIERTMATYLGASVNISEEDINEQLIKDSAILYFEGYLWDSPSAKAALLKAIKIAKTAGTKISFTLSDPLCVDRHRDDFCRLINEDVDIFFANEHEIEALYSETNIRKILYRINGKCEIAAITRSEKGSYILVGDDVHTIDPVRIEDVYDVTGAGDLYAAGFLYGYINNFSHEKSGNLASLCASEVIKYLGGRAATKLPNLLEKL